MKVTAYVDYDGDLIVVDTAERLRRATASESRESASAMGGTGAILADVAERTLRARAPRWWAGHARGYY